MSSLIVLSLIGLLSGHPPASDVPDENYDFLSVTKGPCVPKIGVKLAPVEEAECARLTEPRRYHGTWRVEFEGSIFIPLGMADCYESRGATQCAWLEGKKLPWPRRWDCSRKIEVEFIGRRNVHPGGYFGHDYRIVVDRLISAKRLPDPYDENCDPELHPELKAKK